MASKTSRSFIWIILILVMFGLGGYGATNFGRGSAAIGMVGDTEIDASAYAREISATLRAVQQQTGQPLPIAQAEAFGLTQQALARVIGATAFDSEAQRIGISVGDDRLRQEVLSIQAFQDMSSGTFSKDQYENALRNAGLTAKEFEANLRADLTRGLLQTAVASGVTAPSAFTDTIYGYVRETRDFTWAKLDLAALENPPAAPDEAALQAWYDANSATYTLPEIKRISYVWLKPETVAATLPADEAALRAEYDARADIYNIPERRLVERLTFPDQETAQAAMDAINAGETTFETLVQDRGFTLEDVDLGDKTESALGEAGPGVFALEQPGLVGPLPSLVGPAIFRVNAILNARNTPFEEVRDILQSELAAGKARDTISEMMADLDDQLAGGATLEELANSTDGMEVETLEWSTASTDGISAYQAFQEAVAQMDEGDFPELIVLEDGGVFALRVDQIDPPRLQDLDEVRDAVLSAVTLEQNLEALQEQAQAMLPKLTDAGESLASLGLAEVTEEGKGRTAAIEGAPADMLEKVFEMAADEWAILPDQDGVILVHLDRILPADQQSEEAVQIKASITDQVAQEIGLDVENAFSAAIQDQAGITLNQGVINAVHSQFP